MLTVDQISAHVEEYRLTTEMKLPALPQTIRAVVHEYRRRTEDKKFFPGLWLHCPYPGKRTGPYKLLPAGYEADANEKEGEEKEGRVRSCEELWLGEGSGDEGEWFDTAR